MVSTIHNLVLNLIQQNLRAEVGALGSCLQLFRNRYTNTSIWYGLSRVATYYLVKVDRRFALRRGEIKEKNWNALHTYYMLHITLLLSLKSCVFQPAFGCSLYTDILSR